MERIELLRLARLGAQARFEALQREMADLVRQFPGLAAGMGQRKPGRPGKGAAAVTVGAPRAKRQMSPAARKRISDAAKKRWTEWRKKNKKD
jgi:hypothetical protein